MSSYTTSTTMYIQAYNGQSTNTFSDDQIESGAIHFYNPSSTTVWVSLGNDAVGPANIVIPTVDGQVGTGFPILGNTAIVLRVPYRNGNIFVDTKTVSGTANIYVSPVLEFNGQQLV